MTPNKILVCDDSSTDLLNLKGILADAGYFVITAASGKEALAKAQSEKPDLIYLDIIMDDQDGYKTCREITKGDATKQIPVVFVSSKYQRADHVWAQMQGAKGLISKPYTPEQILENVKTFD